MTSTLVSVAIALAVLVPLAPAAPAYAEETEPRVVERKRVVVRVNVDPSGDGYSYSFVDHEDGEPVVLDSFVAERGYLGVSLLELTQELRVHFGAPEDSGVMISKVEADSPAQAAGLRAGDILLTLNGAPLDSSHMAARLIAAGSEGDRIELGIARDGAPETVTATLDRRQRKQLDLGGMMRGGAVRLPHGRGHWQALELPEADVPFVELDPQSMGEALRMAREHLDSPEWRESLERHGQHRLEVEERIRALEERLKELEEQLGELPD
jgi:membrane-associated protease RseP (regulator of RpoE activity)